MTLVITGIYLYLQAKTIYGGDAGDFVSAINVFGIPHPPGYPLYTLIGVILSHLIPIGTYAWKVGFLSTIPAIFTIIVLYDLIFYLTRKVLISFASSLVIAFVYPFWLYSEVVEVFSLNNFFLVVLIWQLIHWQREGKAKYIYFAALTFGLALSHHHIILFMVPSLLYLILKKRQNITKKIVLGSLGLFILGLLPYIYILIVASINNSPINWMGPLSLTNFTNLITRARYGTFQSGGYTAQDPILRLLNVWAFFDFLIKDFRMPGIILAVLGIYGLIKSQKTILISLLLGFFSYLFFLYLASFPLVDDFMVATFERFILTLYILLMPMIAFGFIRLEIILAKLLKMTMGVKSRKIIGLVALSFMIYPLGLFFLNYPRISILKNDFTAENLGRDILMSVPENSILILTTDTPLFNTQYVFYAEKYRTDVKLIHMTELFSPDGLMRLKIKYHDLDIPEIKEDSKLMFGEFLAKNYPKFPIYSKLFLKNSQGDWIPYGLVFRFIKKGDNYPSDGNILAENDRLWKLYKIPTEGSLSKFHNLMLSDVIPSYAIAHQEIGFWAVKRKYSRVGENHLLEAEKLYPKDLDSYIILAQSYILDGRCRDAEKQIGEVEKRRKDDARIYFLQSINYASCFKDKVKALYYQKLYEEKKDDKEIMLRDL